MATRYPAIGDIRGRGAMMAIELIVPGTTRPDADLVGALNRYRHAHGVVTLTAGTYGNVFRFLPPLTMPLPLLHEAFDVLEQAFAGGRRAAAHGRSSAPPAAVLAQITWAPKCHLCRDHPGEHQLHTWKTWRAARIAERWTPRPAVSHPAAPA